MQKNICKRRITMGAIKLRINTGKNPAKTSWFPSPRDALADLMATPSLKPWASPNSAHYTMDYAYVIISHSDGLIRKLKKAIRILFVNLPGSISTSFTPCLSKRTDYLLKTSFGRCEMIFQAIYICTGLIIFRHKLRMTLSRSMKADGLYGI